MGLDGCLCHLSLHDRALESLRIWNDGIRKSSGNQHSNNCFGQESSMDVKTGGQRSEERWDGDPVSNYPRPRSLIISKGEIGAFRGEALQMPP